MIALVSAALASSPGGPGHLVAGLEGQLGARSQSTRQLGTAATVGWRTRHVTVEASARRAWFLGTETGAEPDPIPDRRHAWGAALIPVLTPLRGTLGWNASDQRPVDLGLDVGVGIGWERTSTTTIVFDLPQTEHTDRAVAVWTAGPRIDHGPLELRLRATGEHWAQQELDALPVARTRLRSHVHTGLTVAMVL
ncbi:MAG: hypothetical protein R3F61_29680 [Myxococcota bacterium]